MDEAKSGVISKRDFARELLRQEFHAEKRVKALLGTFRLTKKEISKSYYYAKVMGCPDDFEESLSYKPKGVTRDALKEYEQMYDSLRKAP